VFLIGIAIDPERRRVFCVTELLRFAKIVASFAEINEASDGIAQKWRAVGNEQKKPTAFPTDMLCALAIDWLGETSEPRSFTVTHHAGVIILDYLKSTKTSCDASL